MLATILDVLHLVEQICLFVYLHFYTVSLLVPQKLINLLANLKKKKLKNVHTQERQGIQLKTDNWVNQSFREQQFSTCQ